MSRLLLAAIVALLIPVAPAHAVLLEVFGPDGSITRIDAPKPRKQRVSARTAAALADSPLRPLQVTGPSAQRIDLVFLGDGYTRNELEKFREHAAQKWAAIKGIEPFMEYASYFNVWMVDVVSNESGVDHDPRPPTLRDTALDAYFYCSGAERGLCVNEGKARAAAAAVPEADQIVVLANSTKYGGIGGTVATSSGGSKAASLITIHELGHSLGGLADEYDYYYRAGLSEDSTEDVTVPAPYAVYPPVLGEPGGVNVTKESSAASLVARQLKWWRWVGDPAAEGGVHGAFEGAGYYRYGLYRPTQDSLMHSLGIRKGGNKFNAPSAEALVGRFYGKVRPIAEATPEGHVGPTTVLRVTPQQPATHNLDIRWFVDGVEVESSRDKRAFIVTPPLAAARERVEVVVSDATGLVRDPRLLAEQLTDARAWGI